MITNEEEFVAIHNKAFRLTGNAGIPYPSNVFAKVFLALDDDEALELLEDRRQYYFPSFLRGDPQRWKLSELITEKGIEIRL